MNDHPRSSCGTDREASPSPSAGAAGDRTLSDHEALGEFVRSGSSAAFAVLTGRYAGLVYGAAWRRTGRHELAEEVAQNVFVILARKAPALLKTQTPLAAWLHRAAVLESSEALRRESVRHRVMKEFATHQELAAPVVPGAALDSILPDLDAALDRLPRSDRELLLARYFEERSYRDLAATTGRSEAALMQQHHRALQKLSRLFHRRGHPVTAAALAAGLGIPFTSAAPVGVAATCAASVSAATATAISTSTLFQLTVAMHTKTHLAFVAVVLCLIAGTGAFFVIRYEKATFAEHAVSLSAGSDPQTTNEASVSTTPPAPALPIPTAGEVLAAEGRERLEKLALWLPGASPAEMGDMLGKLAALDETRSQRTEKELIIQRWVEVDRQGAFVAIRKGEGDTWLACKAFGRLHPREAWAEAQKMDDYEIGYVLQGISEVDPSLARELLASTDKSKLWSINRSNADIANSLARKDARQGWEYALERGAWAEVAVEEFFRADPEGAIASAFAQLTTQRQAQAVEWLTWQLRSSAPEKIEPLLDKLSEGRAKWQAQTRHVQWLSRTDSDAALAYTRKASPALRPSLMQEMAVALARTKPEESLRLLRELDWRDTGHDFRVPEVITPGIMENPSREAKADDWLASLSGRTDGPSQATEALRRLADHGHLAEALAVAESVPSGPRREQAVAAVASGWPADHVYELSAWLAEQDVPSVREAGASRLVRHLLAEAEPDYEAAARWAALLPATEHPESTPLVEVMQKWRAQDSDAAHAALQTLPMPEAVRAVLEKPTTPQR